MTAGTTIPQRAWAEQVMGVPVSIHLHGGDLAAARVEGQVAAVFADLRHLDAVFSPYRDDSHLSRWGRGELVLADADPTSGDVIKLCDEARDSTGGWFDSRGLPDPRTGLQRVTAGRPAS